MNLYSLQANWVLNAVEQWADGYWMIRETSLVHNNRRVDALLVPVGPEAHCMKKCMKEWFWNRPRLIGIEVKVNRGDFLKGLRNGQYDAYDKLLSGLYIAMPKGLAKIKEVPKQFGVLTVWQKGSRNNWRCLCHRHPIYTDPELPADIPWKLLFKAKEEFRQRERDMYEEYRRKLRRIGGVASYKIFNTLRQIEKNVDKEFELLNQKGDGNEAIADNLDTHS